MLPGKIPGYKSDDIKLLSSSNTKMSVSRDFQRACEQSNKQSNVVPRSTKNTNDETEN